MRKRASILIYILVITIMALLQTSFFPQFIILRIKPDLVLLFVISIGLLKGYREGILVGFIGGIITGIVSWNLWGLYILCYCLAGLTAGTIPERIETDNFLVPFLSAIIGSAGFAFVFSGVAILLDIYYPTFADLYKIPVFLIWNAIFALPVFFMCKNVIVPPGRELEFDTSVKNKGYTID